MSFRSEAERDFLEILKEVGTTLTFENGATVLAVLSPVSLEKDLQAGGFIEKASYEGTVREIDLDSSNITLAVGKTVEMAGKRFRVSRVEALPHSGLDRFYLTEK